MQTALTCPLLRRSGGSSNDFSHGTADRTLRYMSIRPIVTLTHVEDGKLYRGTTLYICMGQQMYRAS